MSDIWTSLTARHEFNLSATPREHDIQLSVGHLTMFVTGEQADALASLLNRAAAHHRMIRYDPDNVITLT